MEKLSLQSAINETPIVFFIFNAEGVFEVSLGKSLSTVGLKPDEAVGQSFRDLYKDFPEVLSTCEEALTGVAATRYVAVGELTFETIYQPILADGKVTHVAGVSIDATEKIKALKELEDMNKAMIVRELRMVELKKEIEELESGKKA